jgi:LPXTG-site transpeptidase (sortase) family protein
MTNSNEIRIKKMKDIGYFLTVTAGAFAVTFAFLYVFGLVPNSFKGAGDIEEIDDLTTKDQYSELNNDYWVGGYDAVESYSGALTKPDRVVISSIGVDTPVGQPEQRDVSVLDQYLTKGAVHYPGSGTVEQGNMFIFGHSTGLSVVRNQAYKAFNNLNKLNKGDIIKVVADGSNYEYKVSSVNLYNEDDALVTFGNSARTLTLSTCNTFGAKQERWVVEAEFYREV